MHQIIGARDENEPAQTIYSQNLLNLTEEVIEMFQDKLNECQLKVGKSFDLEIADSMESGFFGYAKEFSNLGDAQFIQHSQRIAEMLATAQSHKKVSGGFVFVLDATIIGTGQKVAAVIKAEMLEALRFEQNQLKVFRDLFFGPQQKLYKFGAIYQLEDWQKENVAELEYPNNEWGAVLFDDQFRPNSSPAAYFWDEFLGFSTFSNPKIQSKHFYEHTEKFILKNIPNWDDKKGLLDLLDMQFKDAESNEISPQEFADTYLNDEVVHDIYSNEVAGKLPEKFVKDPSLIKSKIKNMKILFPGGIKINGTKENMDSNVEVINSEEELKNLSTNQNSYTIIKIKGKPFRMD